ncbi:hypothetical protein E2C01_063727 [Portunus trituberculatus]|uniref:Uncharacterized protein n=1 Tax=Portunus trituberculatus TaxID=210409 RepID=A0A5B7H9X7_PORTR|nr:hypothetical protein [Portunus trituberculatus]
MLFSSASFSYISFIRLHSHPHNPPPPPPAPPPPPPALPSSSFIFILSLTVLYYRSLFFLLLLPFLVQPRFVTSWKHPRFQTDAAQSLRPQPTARATLQACS